MTRVRFRPAPRPGHRRRLRVVLVLKTAQGGLWTLAQGDELRRRGHELVVILPPGPGRLRDQLAQRGVTVLTSPFGFRFRPHPRSLRDLWRLRPMIRSLAPDVVFYHLYASALAARLTTLGLPAARVHMVPGPLFLESWLIRGVERVLSRLDRLTIGGSEHTAGRYRALGRRVERTPAVAYGVDVDAFTPGTSADRDQARARLGVDSGTFVVIMVAYVYAPKASVLRGQAVKGHEVLLAAWQRFAATHRRVHLLLVGSGFDPAGERHRQRLLDRFRIATDPRITWLGSVPDVRAYYPAADLSVSPSLSENHGAALEAGAMGVPGLVSDAGALPETVTAGSGWVVPRGDPAALVRALAAAHAEFQTGVLAERGWLARKHIVARFDQRRCAAAVADLIERAAGAGSPPPDGQPSMSPRLSMPPRSRR